MRRPRPRLVLPALAILLSVGATDRTAELLVLHKDALALLDRIAAAPAGQAEALRREASGKLDALAAEQTLLAGGLRDELRSTASALREGTLGASDGRLRRLLDEVGRQLQEPPLGLDFAGSYSVTKKPEPVYGGHSAAGAPPPPPPPSARGGRASPVQLEVGAALPHKTYCGGPTKDHILESTGSGVAILDYDGDGLEDVYLVNAYELGPGREPIAHANALFRNRGGWRFEDVSSAAGVAAAAWGNGVCAGDYDDDGRLDLYVTNFGRNLLFRNDGKGGFTEKAPSAGVAASGWSTGCAFFDADGDGDLDLYVARYVATSWEELKTARRTLDWRAGPKVMVGPAGLPGEADLFFENRGKGEFVEAGAAHGLADPGKSYGLGVVATDYDNDGWIDLFVANDSNPNFLFRNVGGGRFESVALVAGVALNAAGRAQAGMGADSGDYDDDGWLDLVLTTFAHDTKTIYRNLGRGAFEDASQASGLAAQTFEPMAWGTAFLDADQDGRLDLFVVNGHIYPNVEDFPGLGETFRQRNQLLVNEGGARFTDVSDTAGGGLQLRRVGRGLAVGDLDDDGDPDLVVNNMDDEPTLLENRPKAAHHWISFRLEKAGTNRFAIGARVTVTQGGRRQVREVRSGGSYLSQSDLRPHFGLGSGAGPVDAEVRLGGRTWRFAGLAVDQRHALTLR
jgi:enediyne biosynthesis protein E4